MFTVAKKFNRFVYDVDHIVEDIFLEMIWLTSCLLFVNYLYESQQNVWKDNILVDDVNKMFEKILSCQ